MVAGAQFPGRRWLLRKVESNKFVLCTDVYELLSVCL